MAGMWMFLLKGLLKNQRGGRCYSHFKSLDKSAHTHTHTLENEHCFKDPKSLSRYIFVSILSSTHLLVARLKSWLVLACLEIRTCECCIIFDCARINERKSNNEAPNAMILDSGSANQFVLQTLVETTALGSVLLFGWPQPSFSCANHTSWPLDWFVEPSNQSFACIVSAPFPSSSSLSHLYVGLMAVRECCPLPSLLHPFSGLTMVMSSWRPPLHCCCVLVLISFYHRRSSWRADWLSWLYMLIGWLTPNRKSRPSKPFCWWANTRCMLGSFLSLDSAPLFLFFCLCVDLLHLSVWTRVGFAVLFCCCCCCG